MQYLFCTVGDYAIAFPLSEVSLLNSATDDTDHECVDFLVEQIGQPEHRSNVFVGSASGDYAWRVDKPLCLCDVPAKRIRKIPSTISQGPAWALGVIRAGGGLHHYLQPFPLAWVIDTSALTKFISLTSISDLSTTTTEIEA